ncbi:hypothetical protein [Nostoc sp. CHAB 5715]|uniref:hypothetical protein n=1 Tax=Nostoc sp. CHAB 5715 TaxID=2780400 RepID=UPI001E319DE3|nr:hypothetical protein [Nostoc sp. CHAB 5715]MCC5620042.1 hypothetical protein [Nostoc sp. CHAB 5715]
MKFRWLCLAPSGHLGKNHCFDFSLSAELEMRLIASVQGLGVRVFGGKSSEFSPSLGASKTQNSGLETQHYLMPAAFSPPLTES